MGLITYRPSLDIVIHASQCICTKASANKNAILVFAFQTTNILHASDELSGSIFSGVYHTQDIQDEKVSLTLAHWGLGDNRLKKKIRPRKFIRIA